MEIDKIISRNFSHISEEYKKFAMEKDKCKFCSLYEQYEQVVQSEGNAKNPTFMMVGECPGQDEIEQGKPFIGKSGQRLREELRKYKNVFNKNTTIITNVLPCRPFKNSFPSKDNGPHKIAIDNVVSKNCLESCHTTLVSCCINQWLRREIEILIPNIIVTLGSKALEYVRNETGVTNRRGTWKYLKEYKAWSMATFHPSYVIRCQNNDDRLDIVQDFVDDIEKVATTWHTLPHNERESREKIDKFFRSYN